MSFFRFLILLGLVLLAACDSARWENPTRPPALWDGDQAACRQEAYVRAQARYDAARSDVSERSLPGPEGEINRRRDDALDRRRQSFEGDAFDACMRAKGYAKVAKPG